MLMELLNYLEVIGLIILVIFFVGMCIFVHELGHFLAAKLCGMHIDAFSIGFKKAWGKTVNGIEYRIGYLPFGGYVELPQVDSTSNTPKTADGRELPRAKPWQRIVTAFAGPLFNIIFGLLLGCVIWWGGIPQDTPNMRQIIVREIAENSPEYRAGLRVGDAIVKLNGKEFFCPWNKFVQEIMFNFEKSGVTLDVVRDGKTFQVSYMPEANTSEDLPDDLRHEGMAVPFFKPLVPIELDPVKNSSAMAAGVRRGDILLEINGKAVNSFEEFQQEIDRLGREKAPVRLKLERGGKTIESGEITPVLLGKIYQIGASFTSQEDCKVVKVIEGSPASVGGLQDGDLILSINGQPTATFPQFYELLQKDGENPLKVAVRRGGETVDLEITPAKNEFYSLECSVTVMNYPTPFQQFQDTLVLSYRSLSGMMIYMANHLGLTEMRSTIKPSNMSGPLGIGQTLFVVFRDGSFMLGLYFVVVVAFALAIFNLLPLPVLDGGHIFFAVIELIIGRPLPEIVIKVLTYIFITLLLGLMVFVTWADLGRLKNLVAPEPPATEAAPEKVPEPEDQEMPSEAVSAETVETAAQ
ncbi:site-2 protease family protein [Victivallis sp. Marseille-Q1083]|uniref:site-2 protease family protein n=1 Tax=Victivallis sp. Marseille-Q1083 TaxID=2717288 RepID=UPI00158D1015|nr:site-2 protease family protein [Victivallis sp. Marseille-Q1083]